MRLTDKPIFVRPALTIIATPVSTSCNLRCCYCFHRDDEIHINEKKTEIMSLDILDLLISQAADSAKKVRFIWHGGEPILAGKNFYKHAFSAQKRYHQTTFHNGIQSNGTLLDDEWIDFFKENNVHLGISLDGTKNIHDKQRLFIDDRGTFDKVFYSAKKANEKLEHTGLLCVITKNSLGKELDFFSFMTNNFAKFDLLPYYESDIDFCNDKSITITPQEYANFMIRIFDLWLEKNDPSIKIRTLQEMVRGVLGISVSLCRYNGSCTNHISINAFGDVYPCDRFGNEEVFKYGNIQTNSLIEILNKIQNSRFVNDSQIEYDGCKDCEWWAACKGDCTHMRYQRNGIFSKKSYYCEANKDIFSHIKKRISSIATETMSALHYEN